VDFDVLFSRNSAYFLILPWELIIRTTVNNFVDWSHIGAVMHYSGYVEPRDGAVSVLLSSQQEAVACVRCILKESHCCEGQFSASGGNRKCRSLSNGKMSGSAKN
jgi:hypothetical protein